MVVALISDGEMVGELDKTARYAGQWLANGAWQPDPYLYQRCMWESRLVAEALECGASTLIVQNGPPNRGRFSRRIRRGP